MLLLLLAARIILPPEHMRLAYFSSPLLLLQPEGEHFYDYSLSPSRSARVCIICHRLIFTGLMLQKFNPAASTFSPEDPRVVKNRSVHHYGG
jgi:hypothetical protein